MARTVLWEVCFYDQSCHDLKSHDNRKINNSVTKTAVVLGTQQGIWFFMEGTVTHSI